jgi:uncharacterized repeat protein (TIGR01451 family)
MDCSVAHGQMFPPCPPDFLLPPCPDALLGLEPRIPENGQVPPAAPPVDPPTPTVALRVRVPADVAAGQSIEYHIFVENTSGAPAHHVTVLNPLPGNARFVRSDPEPTLREPALQWRFGTLDAGAKREITLVLMPMEAGDINNCARVQFEHGQCVRTKISLPSLRILKEGPAQANLNETLNFTLTVTNTSNVPASNVLLADVLPAGLQHSSGKNRLSWIIEKLGPGESKSVDYQVIAKATGRLCNKAIASADGGVREETENCVTVTEAKLKLSAVGPAKRYLHTPAQYEVTVSNEGTADLTDVRIAGDLPSQFSFVSASDGGQYADNHVQWTIGALAPGASRTVQLVLSAQSPGRFCQRVIATAERGPSEQAEACTDFTGVPALELSVEDSEDPVEVGATTTYRIAVRNPGTTPATNVQVTTQIPLQMQLVRAAGTADHREAAGKITFNPVSLAVGGVANYEVEVRAVRPADVRFKVELTADQLIAGPVQQEESTTIYAMMPSSRRKVRDGSSTSSR